MSSSPPPTVPLNYRARPARSLPAWLTRDKLAELCVGLGWTSCGAAAILTSVAWVFLRMEPRQPIAGPWWAFIAICLGFNTIGVALAMAMTPMRMWHDRILAALFVMAILLGLAVYAAHALLIATAPEPIRPSAPLQFQPPEGESA